MFCGNFWGHHLQPINRSHQTLSPLFFFYLINLFSLNAVLPCFASDSASGPLLCLGLCWLKPWCSVAPETGPLSNSCSLRDASGGREYFGFTISKECKTWRWKMKMELAHLLLGFHAKRGEVIVCNQLLATFREIWFFQESSHFIRRGMQGSVCCALFRQHWDPPTAASMLWVLLEKF